MRLFLSNFRRFGQTYLRKAGSCLAAFPKLLAGSIMGIILTGYSALVGALISFSLLMVAGMLLYAGIFPAGLVFGPGFVRNATNLYWGNWMNVFLVVGIVVTLLKLADILFSLAENSATLEN